MTKRRAASKKAWRTRKRMKLARTVEAMKAARRGDLVVVGSPDKLLGSLYTAAEVERYLFGSNGVLEVPVRYSSKNLLPPNPFLEIGDPEKQTLINNDW